MLFQQFWSLMVASNSRFSMNLLSQRNTERAIKNLVRARHSPTLPFAAKRRTRFALLSIVTPSFCYLTSKVICKSEEVYQIIEESDIYYDNYIIDKAYSVLRKYKDSENTEILWRLARILCEKSKITRDVGEKKRFIYEAYDVIKKAIDKSEKDCANAHKWYGIILNYIGEFEGYRQQILNSYEIRKHFEKALAINDKDPTTWHLLGVWHFACADLSYPLRLIAKTIFGTPPLSTFESALEYFEKAESVQPNFYSRNTWYLAEVYERLGRYDEAKAFYLTAFKMPIITIDDIEVHRMAHEKLRSLGIQVESSQPRPWKRSK